MVLLEKGGNNGEKNTKILIKRKMATYNRDNGYGFYYTN